VGALDGLPLVGAIPEAQLRRTIKMKQQRPLETAKFNTCPNPSPVATPQICIPPNEVVPLSIDLAGAANPDSLEPRTALHRQHWWPAYTLKEILTTPKKAKPLLKGGITDFYTPAAELPREPEQQENFVRIRSFAWPNGSNSDSMMQGKGSFSVPTITINTQSQIVNADSGTDFICCPRSNLDGPFYALPMISVDGLEFSALP
jgi:hypothetical protein